MTLLILLGLAIVAVVLCWAASHRRSEMTASSQSSSDVLVRLPPRNLFARCLSAQDVAFISGLGSPDVLRLLLRERRRLALEWLRLTRCEAGRLFRLHLRGVRHSANLRPVTEARLLVDMVRFLVIYQLMAAMVRFYGPLRTQSFVRSVEGLADVLSTVSGHIAQAAAPAGFPNVQAAGGR